MNNLIFNTWHSAKGFKSVMTYLLAFLMLLSISPVNVLAQEAPQANESINFIYFDGERIPYDDERITNIVPVVAPSGARARSGNLPPVSHIAAISAEFARNPNVTMGGTTVSAQRYAVIIDGVSYEAFCADPTLPGPESNATVYELTGEAQAVLLPVLRYGFPANSYFSDPSILADVEDAMWYAYITRVAVAMATNPNRTFAGDNTALSQARGLVESSAHWVKDYENTKPAIMVNGVRWAEDTANMIPGGAATAQSGAFNVTHNRRTHEHYNRFRFEWAPGTPAGAELHVNGSLLVTAPANSNQVFSGDVSFHIQMPNQATFHNLDAKVYLVGLHNEFANRVWMMQNPNDRDNWQDIVFFIPYMRASATFAFEPTYVPPNGPPPNGSYPEPRETAVRIQKIDALSRENIPGALIRLRGMSSHQVVTGDGNAADGDQSNRIWEIDNTGINISQVLTAGATTAVPGDVTSTVTDGVWTLTGLPYGFYMVEEERAPDGYSLLPQHTAFGFWLLPPNVIVQGEGHPIVCPVTGEVLEVIIEYEIIEDGTNVNSILITFENYPFGEIIAYKHCSVTNEPLAGAHIRIQGFFVEGNAPVITDRTYITDSSGRVVFRDLPAGTYTLTEIVPPPSHMLAEVNHHSVNLSWGQRENNPARPAPVVRFYNEPYTYLEVLKIDGNTNAPLAGAIFMLSDPTTGEEWLGTTGSDGRVIIGQEGSQGNFLIPGRTYILREIQAPTQPRQYVLNSEPRSVVLSNRGRNEIVVANYHNPSLTIIKRDAANHALLAGAVFEVAFENGQTVAGSPFTTDNQGRIVIPNILGDNETERTLIVTELSPPPGFNLATPNWQRVVIRAGEDNVVTFDNERKPTLTIQKIDSRTGYPIRGAWFEIEFLGATAGTGSGNIGPSGPLTGNPFITDQNGRIVIEGVYSGRYRIREIRSANNYWLDTQESNRTWIIEVRDNEDYTLVVENTLLPTLVITKRNAVTWRPIPMTRFRVDFEVPNSPHVQHIGYFNTNNQGQIILPFVQVGWYRVVEVRPAPGMTLATNNSFRVFLQPGDNSYSLIRDGVIASESMVTPSSSSPPTPPPASDEPVFEPDEEREYLPSGNSNIPNAPTPDIPSDAEVEVLEPDTEAIIDQELAPEQADPSNNSNPPDIPDLDEDWFNNADLENLPINHYDNPNLPSEANGRLNVWGGEAFWNNELEIWNFPQNTLVIRKENAVTGKLLAGARFSVTRVSSGDDSGLHGTVIGEWTTNHSGILVIAGLDPGFYIIEETQSPPNFTLAANTRQHVFMRPDDTSVVSVTFSNMPFSGLLITLRCSVTGAPIPRGEFRVTNSSGAVLGTDNGHFWTNLQGEIQIPNVTPDSYVITQVTVPPEFVIDLVQSTQTIRVNPTGQIYRVDFFSDPLSNLLITLRCEVSGQPIQNGEFRITNSAGNVVGSANGIFFTDLQGEILIPGLGVDSYVVTQLNAPAGFRLGQQNSQTIFIQRPAETYALNFTNEPYSGLIIQNLDGYNGDPLPGVRFRIDRINETGNVLVGEHVTDHNGQIELIGLLGSFTITQVDVPNGWEHDPQPTRIVHVNAGTPTLVTFVSPRMGSLEITLSDEDGNPLAGGRFEVRRQNGQLVGEFVTPASGMISVPSLGSGWFTVEQIAPAPNHVLTDTGRSVEVATNTVARAHFVNILRPALVIEKVDTDGNPLAGAEFEVRTLSGALIHRGVTNNGGIITIAQLDPMALTITETRAPEGFVITEPSRTIEIVAGQTLVERFVNHRAPALIIEKVCEQGNPLAGAEFEIRRLNGELVHRVTTNNGGMAVIDVLEPGAYQILETRAPDGFAIVEPSRAIQIVAGQTLTERFVNPRLATFVIHKIDGATGESLQGVVFEITTLAGERIRNPQNNSFEFVTDNAGMIRLPQLEAGSYVAVELRPLPGFMAADPMPFVVGHDRDYIITVRNYRYPDYTIRKLDGHTLEPLAGVQFEIARFFADGRSGDRLRNPADGSFIWTTDRAGLIRIPNLEHGTWVATEIRPLPGFILADPVVFVVDDHQSTTITIHNYRYSEWNILKLDGDTGRPLQGVVFEVAHFFGSGTTGERLRNPQNGSFEFVSDAAGIARIGALPRGTFVITETRALPGFRIAEPVIITVGENEENTTVTIRNYRDAELSIRKINSITRAPLEGVVFEISRPDGTRLVNPQTGFHDFVTDRNGLIFLPTIEDGRFYLRETRALPGFIVDEEVIAFNIDASARQREHLLVVENTPAAGLLIVKIDAQTRRPLAGVEFEVRHADGRLVTGQMLDGNQPGTPANSPQVAANGNFITDSNGRINLNHLAPGVYHVTEKSALPGYQLDSTVHVVTVIAGQQTVLEVENSPLAGFRLLKVCAVTGEGIFNVEFMVFDHNGKVVGVFYTDNNGVIDFSAILAPGRYTIRETRPAPGFARDDVPRTVEFVAGRVTEIIWENIPIAGQLQILKVSGDDNQHNGLPAGTPLQGAIFEIFEARTGNLVDRIVSNERGMAVSRPLPLGRYIAREVAAPAFYMINPQEIHFDLEHENQIVRVTFPNFSANMGVTIRKTGPQEAMQGHNIMYEITTVRNDSSTPLADFFWRDVLPTNAVRADRLVTGTYNHALRYRVLATTNRGNEIVVADNLSTLTNNVIELRPVHLGLAANEYIVDITLFFGQVPAGFTSVERPRIFVDVLPESHTLLPNGMMFANKVDVGGRVPGSDEWVIGNSTTATTIFSTRRIPQSGW